MIPMNSADSWLWTLHMLTERDEFIYHEMIAHLPMNANPAIRKSWSSAAGQGHGEELLAILMGGRHGGNRRGSRARLPGVFAAHGACIR